MTFRQLRVTLLGCGLAILAGILPWGWTPQGTVIAGIDTPPYVDFSVLYEATRHTWDPVPNGGISNIVGYGMFWPYLLLARWLQVTFQASPHVLTIGALSLAFAIGTGAAFLLALAMRCGSRIATLAAVAYTLNFAHTFLAPGSAALFAYAALPVALLAIVTAAGASAARETAIGILLGVLSTVVIYIKINPPTYVALIVGAALLGGVASYAVYGRLPWRFAIAFIVVAAAENAWWAIDFIQGLHLDPNTVTADLNATFVSAKSTLSQVILLGGSWAFDPAVGDTYFRYAAWYRNPFIQTLLTLFPAATIALLVFFFRFRGTTALLTIVVVLAITDAGYHAPFGTLFAWTFAHVPLFWLFREPLTKFDGTLAVAYVLGLLIVASQARDPVRRSVCIACACVATLGAAVGGKPLIDGTVLQAHTATHPGYQVRVPDYWTDFARWANHAPGGRIAMLPRNAHYELRYAWGYHGADIDGMLLRHPYIDVTPSAGYTDSGLKIPALAWYDAVWPSRDATLLARLSDVLQIEYVVVRGDVRATALSPNMPNEAAYAPTLRAAGFTRRAAFGPLHVYARGCCSHVADVVPLVAPAAFVRAMPQPAWATWYPDLFAAVTAGAAVNTHAAGVPSRLFTFGVLTELSPRSIDFNALTATQTARGRARVTRSEGTAFVALGSHVELVSNGSTLNWIAPAGSFAANGEAIFARPLRTMLPLGVPTVVHGTPGARGLLSFRLARGTCAHATVDQALHVGDAPFAQDNVDVWRMTTVAIPIRLESFVTVSARPCSAGTSAIHVRAWRVIEHRAFRLAVNPVRASGAAQAADLALHATLSNSAFWQACRCVVRYAFAHVMAPSSFVPSERSDVVVFSVPPGGTVSDILAAPSADRTSSPYTVGRGRVLILCRCASSQPVNLEARTTVGVPAAVAPVRASIVVRESSPTASAGTVTFAHAGELVLPQSYSNGWELRIDDRIVRHAPTLLGENAWLVPAGHHDYHLAFRLERRSRVLERVAAFSALPALLLAIALAFVPSRFLRPGAKRV